eukprot:SAG11_NODE_522_length_8776_cov_6.087242_5_plen_51_part_00
MGLVRASDTITLSRHWNLGSQKTSVLLSRIGLYKSDVLPPKREQAMHMIG